VESPNDGDNLREALVTWEGGFAFAVDQGGPTALIDADGQEAPGPMVTLLLAAAACRRCGHRGDSLKMQVTLHDSTQVSGRRAPEHPKRYLAALRLPDPGDGLGKPRPVARWISPIKNTAQCCIL
jgi:hypothetical protein